MLLDIKALTHQYKDGKNKKSAINSFSLQIKPGILGLLGPNGAGKSSLMRILATITKPTGGEVYWNGNDIVESPNSLRHELGYLPQYFGVYNQLSGVEFLRYIASLKGIELAQANHTIDEILNKLNLAHVQNLPLSGYSGGMKQRIGIAQALLNDPKVLIIDEPTVGLDPHERNNFRQLLSELSGDRCIVFSTHIVSDIESIADRIAIMQSGNLVKAGSPNEILQSVDDKCWSLTVKFTELAEIQHRYIVSHSLRKGDFVELDIISNFCPDESAVQRTASLEDAYLYLTSNNAQQDMIVEA